MEQKSFIKKISSKIKRVYQCEHFCLCDFLSACESLLSPLGNQSCRFPPSESRRVPSLLWGLRSDSHASLNHIIRGTSYLTERANLGK